MSQAEQYRWGIIGAGVLVTLALLVWAAFVRGARKKRRRSGRPYNWEIDPGHRSKRRHRRHRREAPAELPRNPTLAETGGLPPIRPQPPDPPPTSSL